ncbi:MAG: hypothetical protein ACPGN3_17170 [Opitutales bacterium]
MSSSFEGEVVGLHQNEVEILRFSDQKVFKSAISAFSEKDQTYIRSIHPGKFIDRVTLRAETLQTHAKSFDLNSGRLHREVLVNTPFSGLFAGLSFFESRRIFVGSKLETFSMRGKTVRVEALTTAGQVRTRLMGVYLSGTQGQIEIADCQYIDVYLDLQTGDTHFHFDPVPAYYGYVVCAINLDSGELMAIRGTKKNAERFVEAELEKILNGQEDLGQPEP